MDKIKQLSKIKVVMHSKSVGYAGTDRTAQLFAKYLDKDKFDVYIVYRECDENERLDIVKEWLGEDRVIPYSWTPGQSGRVPPYIPESQTLSEVLQKIDPDIVHIHRSGFAEWPGFRTMAPRAKWVETNIFGFNDASRPSPIDLNIYISNFIKDAALKAGNKDGPVIYNPIEQPVLDMTEENKNKCRESLLKRLDLPNDAVLVGRVGRPDNFDPIALQAFKEINNDKAFYLVVNPCEKWTTTAKELGVENIRFIDPIIGDDELSRFYMGLDIYAHARSDGECCPCNIQEAMMHGLPVVSHYSAVYNGQSEIIGSGGFCVRVGDVNGYSKVLTNLVENKNVRSYIGREARRRAMRDFEASCIASKLEGMYEWLLKNE